MTSTDVNPQIHIDRTPFVGQLDHYPGLTSMELSLRSLGPVRSTSNERLQASDLVLDLGHAKIVEVRAGIIKCLAPGRGSRGRKWNN